MTADLDQLGDEEADGLAGTTSSSGAATAAANGSGGGRSSAAGAAAAAATAGAADADGSGSHKQERGGLTEAQTFSDLAFSRNKVRRKTWWCVTQGCSMLRIEISIVQQVQLMAT